MVSNYYKVLNSGTILFQATYKILVNNIDMQRNA